jgi:hypothetical protein
MIPQEVADIRDILMARYEADPKYDFEPEPYATQVAWEIYNLLRQVS